MKLTNFAEPFARPLEVLVMWAFRQMTRNYYVWVVSAWLLWPLVTLMDIAIMMFSFSKDVVMEVADSFSGPGWKREQWKRLRDRHQRKWEQHQQKQTNHQPT